MGGKFQIYEEGGDGVRKEAFYTGWILIFLKEVNHEEETFLDGVRIADGHRTHR